MTGIPTLIENAGVPQNARFLEFADHEEVQR
jgi:hypothetical protein